MGSGETLVRICDSAGRSRGTGFVADDRGTVVTSHEAVDVRAGVVLHAQGGRSCLVGADAVTVLPELGLALLRTDGLGLRPLPISERETIETGTYVRAAALGWREARVLGAPPVTYRAGGRDHLLGAALELAMGTDGSDALRPGSAAAGGPVVDASTGAVLGVLGTTLRCAHPAAALAVPLSGTALLPLLRRNAATVPGHGRDLNLAGVLELTALSVGPSGEPAGRPDPVERPELVRRLAQFTVGDSCLLALAGEPGTGRTTELRALAARRAVGAQPAPTIWLRGADLHADDTSVADALARTVRRAGRIVDAADTENTTPERIAGLAAGAGQPLLVLLDNPEEMPQPTDTWREWTERTVQWLRAHSARMIIGCRPGHGDRIAALAPDGTERVPLTDLTPGEAAVALRRFGIPEGMLPAGDAGHPLTLRMVAEVRAVLPGTLAGRPTRAGILTAYLDLLCLRIAVRIEAAREPAVRGPVVHGPVVHDPVVRPAERDSAELPAPAEPGRPAERPPTGHGSAVRRLAAEVAGQLHEAARRCLGTGRGDLDRTSFEELFPWHTGWASAVLTEGLLTPAGSGYRFAHSELADWLQAEHLDLDEALRSLVHRPPATGRPLADPAGTPGTAGPVPAPVLPGHRRGAVVQALLLLEHRQGPAELGRRLRDLVQVLDRLPDQGTGAAEPGDSGSPRGDARWWAAHLLGDVLSRVPDPRRYLDVLRLLADRITRLSVRSGCPRRTGWSQRFGGAFWERLRIGESPRLDLLRRLVPADGAPDGAPGNQAGDRCLDAVARLLAADPRSVQPLLCRWFSDERPLPHGAHTELRPTVAGAAQALLYSRRCLAVDDLAEALVATSHPRADELLAALAEDEPSAMCRSVDRWAHDDRPGRRAAAAAHLPRAALHATAGADRELLRYAALALLARPGGAALHGPAFDLLVRDPPSRDRQLPRALSFFAAGHPQLPAAALGTALATHPEPVLAAFRMRVEDRPESAAEILRALAEAAGPEVFSGATALVLACAGRHPDGAAQAAAFVDHLLEHGIPEHGRAARAALLTLVGGLLRGRPGKLRSALATVLAAPGSRCSQPVRDELLDMLLDHERFEAGRETPDDTSVAEALLRAAALGSGTRAEFRTRDLVHRTGLLLVRTPEGAACFDGRLVALCRELPEFAGQVAEWLTVAPQEWAVVVGPSTRRTVQKLGAPMPMQAAGTGHGSLRPA